MNQQHLIHLKTKSLLDSLIKVGRYKFNRKLNVSDRLLNQTLAEDITDGKKVVLEKGTVITKANINELNEALAKGFGLVDAKINEELDSFGKVQIVKIADPADKKKKLLVIGNDQSIDIKRLTISDVYAAVSYYLNLLHGVGNYDEIDHLGNRRIRQVGELLQNQFRLFVKE